MDRNFAPPPTDLVQMNPGLAILRLAALLAEGRNLDSDSLDLMFKQIAAGVLDGVAPMRMWPELARGLMARSPSMMIQALRQSGALSVVLPEVAALFDVPQIADGPAEVDIGAHLLSALDEAARCGASLEVRFALLTMNVGKADSPREHLPTHYRHVERGVPRVEAMCNRLRAPEACHDLAVLAVTECERLHRASEIRAGPVAQLLDRAGAFSDPAQFRRLMTVCSCDYFAYGWPAGRAYPKAALVETALEACAGLNDAEDLQAARAAAIARAFRSERWSEG